MHISLIFNLFSRNPLQEFLVRALSWPFKARRVHLSCDIRAGVPKTVTHYEIKYVQGFNTLTQSKERF